MQLGKKSTTPKQWFFIYLFFALLSFNGYCFVVCPDEQKTAVINVGFDYRNSRRRYLEGVAPDLETMKTLFPEIDKKNITTINDETLGNSTKTIFLDSLKKAVEGKNQILFNYSGHGALNEKGELLFLLPGYPGNCLRKDKETSDFVVDIYRGFVTKNLADSKKKELNFKYEVYDDTDPKCSPFLVGSDDLSSIFKGKTVSGIVDSCYSGALSLSTGENIIYSSSRYQTSKDSKTGGYLFRLVNHLKNEFACSITQNGTTDLRLSDLLNRLPAVFLGGTDALFKFSVEPN